MPIAVVTQKNTVAAAYGTAATHGALFTADPGTTGTTVGEVTGGSPAYARKPISWGAPANGVITGVVTFDVPTGTTVAFAGVCGGLTGSNLLDRIAITSQAFASQGTLQVTFTETIS